MQYLDTHTHFPNRNWNGLSNCYVEKTLKKRKKTKKSVKRKKSKRNMKEKRAKRLKWTTKCSRPTRSPRHNSSC